MVERKARCRYLKINAEPCNVEVAFEGSILLCQSHLYEAFTMLHAAGKNMVERFKENQGSGALPTPALPPLTPRQYDGVVYYVRFGDRIKIGTSTNLESRMAVIPHDEFLTTEPGGYQREQMRHRQFAYCRLIGEWFKGDDPKLLAHIAELRKRHGVLPI